MTRRTFLYLDGFTILAWSSTGLVILGKEEDGERKSALLRFSGFFTSFCRGSFIDNTPFFFLHISVQAIGCDTQAEYAHRSDHPHNDFGVLLRRFGREGILRLTV